MPFTDLPLDQLRTLQPEAQPPADLNRFWFDTLAQARAAAGQGGEGGHSGQVSLRSVASPVTELIIQDLTFPGFGGEAVKAWVTRPARTRAELPAVVEYVGYGGGRGLPGERLSWAAAGFVHVLMDTRGQGSEWSDGATPDPHGAGPAASGWMTKGIESRETYYYRRVFTDAVRLVDATASLSFVDASRIAITGLSQGGGIAIAAAALNRQVAAIAADVAFLCDFPRSVGLAIDRPFSELARYLAVHADRVEPTFQVLAYFDAANLARLVTCPAPFSVALMDTVVPPSGTFAAFNVLGSTDKEMVVYPYANHEGGGFRHWLRQVKWLGAKLV